MALGAVGVFLLYMSWGPLENLFVDYQDSPTWVYLMYGAFFAVPGVALLGLGAWLLRRSTRHG